MKIADSARKHSIDTPQSLMNEVMTMPRTREELEQAAADARAWLDSIAPGETPAEDSSDLRRIGMAVGEVANAQTELAQAVEAARANGRSWERIAMVLGVSRQAARERFGQPANH